MIIGSHVSMSGPDFVLGSVEEALGYGANALMLYTGAPQNTKRKELSELNIEAARKCMAENGVIWTPTVSPIGNLKGGGRFDDEITEKITMHHLNMIKMFAELGGNIALGSDGGAWRVPHVEGLRTELEYLRPIVSESHLANTEKLMKNKFSKGMNL